MSCTYCDLFWVHGILHDDRNVHDDDYVDDDAPRPCCHLRTSGRAGVPCVVFRLLPCHSYLFYACLRHPTDLRQA